MNNEKVLTHEDAEELSGKHMVIPDCYTKIAIRSGLLNGKDIESIAIPASIKEIEPDSLSGFYDLKSIHADANSNMFKVVDGILFSKDGKTLIRCPPKMGITSYVMPDDVTTIESGAFSYCRELEDITLSSGLTMICSEAFDNCSKLKRLDIPAGVKEIGALAFCSCRSLESITIPESASIDGKVFLSCYSLEDFVVKKASGRQKRICTADGVLFNEDKTVLIDYPIGNKRDSYVIADGVREIMPGTFEDALNLVEITVPESVEVIGHSAFKSCCNLERVNIPHGVKIIESWTFYFCRALKSITIPHGVTHIGYSAFSSCDGITEIVLPETVTKIETGAFSCCFGLTDITIPESVTDIDSMIISSMNPFTVHCKEGSHIHKYAVENNLVVRFI